MPGVFISTLIFLRHHSFDASPLILLMSKLWVVAGIILLLSAQMGSPSLSGYYLYDIMSRLLFIREIYFFPSYSNLQILWMPILDLLPLLSATLIRFYTPRPPNKFVYILCYAVQLFIFFWVEVCGPHIYYKLTGSIAFFSKKFSERFLVSGFFLAIFSLDMLALCLYCLLIFFHYHLNLSFIYAQNTATIKASRLFFAPTFIYLHRFRAFYIISLLIQHLFDNIVFTVYFSYCILLFINGFLISSRGSLSYVHNGPWITLFLSFFVLFISLYSSCLTIMSLWFTVHTRYNILTISLFFISLVVSLGLTSTLLILGGRSRISIVNDYKIVRLSYSSKFSGKRLALQLLSTLSSKHLKFKSLTPHEDQTVKSFTSSQNTEGTPEMQQGKEVLYSKPDTILLLDPVSVQNYVLETTLSRNMVLALNFYFGVHNVMSLILPNTYGLTIEDIYSLTHSPTSNKAALRAFESILSDQSIKYHDSYRSMDQLPNSESRGQLCRSRDLLLTTSVFNEPLVPMVHIKKRRSVSVGFHRNTLMSSMFSIPNHRSRIAWSASQRSPREIKHKSQHILSRINSIFTELSDTQEDAPFMSHSISQMQYNASDDTLSFCSNVLLEDQLIYRFLPRTRSANKFPSLAFNLQSLNTRSMSRPSFKKDIMTPNQKLFHAFLSALDPKKIFQHVLQAESILETFRLFYENIYASLFLSYCAASQTLESMTLLDIEECLPIPLLLRYLRAWKTPGDAYNSIIYYIDQLKTIDNLKREYQPMRNNRRRPNHSLDNQEGAYNATMETIYLNIKNIPTFKCKETCTNCKHCTAYVKCTHCSVKIILHFKPVLYLILGYRSNEKITSLKNFACPVCNWHYLLKIVDLGFLRRKRREASAKGDLMSIRPRMLHDYIVFLGKLTPLGRPLKAEAMMRRKASFAKNSMKIPSLQRRNNSCDFEIRRYNRAFIQSMFKLYINDIEGDADGVLGLECNWANGMDVRKKAQSSPAANKQTGHATESKKFSMDRNIGLLHKSYSVISPQHFTGSIYFLSPEAFTDYALTDGSKKFLYNCRKQNYLLSIFLPTVTSTSSTTGNIHRLSFSYDRMASLTGPLRILRMKVLIHLARMIFPIHLYVDNIYPIQLVPCYKFYTFGSNYIENANSRLRVVYSPEFVLKRQEDFEIRIISSRTSMRKMLQGVSRQEALYLYCLAQNALTVKMYDKMDSSLLQFVNVEYVFMQVAFTGTGSPYLSFFYQLYYTNNVSFFWHLLSLSRMGESSSSPTDLASKLNQHRSNLSAIPESIVINALAVSLNCHTLSDQAADAYAVIHRLLTAMYSIHLPIYTWLEMIKIRLLTCEAYMNILYTVNSDVFTNIEAASKQYSKQGQKLFSSRIKQSRAHIDPDSDSEDKLDKVNDVECISEKTFKLGKVDKKLLATPLKNGHSFGINTAKEYYKLKDVITKLLNSCQSLLEKQLNELELNDEAHDIQVSKLLNECLHFFEEHYAASTMHLLHLTFDLSAIVGYVPSASHHTPIYQYDNGTPHILSQGKDDKNQNTQYSYSTVDMDEHAIGMANFDSPKLERCKELNDSDSNIHHQPNLLHENLIDNSMDHFRMLFLPNLPHMAVDSTPKTMVISPKQVSNNFFAIYEHAILENDLLDAIMLNNVSVNGLPSVYFNRMAFSLLNFLGRRPLRLIAQKKSSKSNDANGSSPSDVEIDLLESLLYSYKWDLKKEAFLDMIVSYFNSKTLYEKVGHERYIRVTVPRLRQIIYYFNHYNNNTGSVKRIQVNPAEGYSFLRTQTDVDPISPMSPTLTERPGLLDNTGLVFPDCSANINATDSYMMEVNNVSIASISSNSSTETLQQGAAPSQLAVDFQVLDSAVALPSRWKNLYRMPWSLRRIFFWKHRIYPQLGEIELYIKKDSEYIRLEKPAIEPYAPHILSLDSVSRQQLLLSLIINFNLLHLHCASNSLTTYEYRGRQFLTLQQNRFIVDSAGEYYPASYRNELEQSYILNFNTQSPEDAVKRFLYCFDESSITFPSAQKPLRYKRYLNTDFDLTIPVEGMKYIHTSDLPGSYKVIKSRSKWLENLKQPDMNTPIDVYECIEKQIAIRNTSSLSRYIIGTKNSLLYYSVIFDTVIQLRSIIRVDTTLRAKMHSYKMLPRLAFFSNYADQLLTTFFERLIKIHKDLLTNIPSVSREKSCRDGTVEPSSNSANDTVLVPLLIPHSKDLQNCIRILQKYEKTVQNLWTMRLTFLRHSYAEEDFLLLMQNECLRALANTYGLSAGPLSDYFFSFFSKLIISQLRSHHCYTTSSIERIFRIYYAKLGAVLNKDLDLTKEGSSTSYLLTPQIPISPNQMSIIRYFALMEHDAKKIGAINKSFFIALGELFAFGKDPLQQIERIAATSPKAAGIYALRLTPDMDWNSRITKETLEHSSLVETGSNIHNTVSNLHCRDLCNYSQMDKIGTKNALLNDDSAIPAEHQQNKPNPIPTKNIKQLRSWSFYRMYNSFAKKFLWLRRNSTVILIIIFYIILLFHLLIIYSYLLTSHSITKNLLHQNGRIAAMMAAFSDLRTEISTNVALSNSTVPSFEIRSTYIERFNEIANNGFLAHVTTSALYNSLSNNEVIETELNTPGIWPPPIIYYSGERFLNLKYTSSTIQDQQPIYCDLDSGTISESSIKALLLREKKWTTNVPKLKLLVLPLLNLRQVTTSINLWNHELSLSLFSLSSIWRYLHDYNKVNIGLFSVPFRKFIEEHPIIFPILSSFVDASNNHTLNKQVNPTDIDYFTLTEILINRVICMSASLISFSDVYKNFDPVDLSVNNIIKGTTYRSMSSAIIESDFLLILYQSTYNYFQSVLLNMWDLYSRYTLNFLTLIALGGIGFGLFIPLYYLHFRDNQRRLLMVRLDRACTLANLLSLPPNVLATLLDSYKQTSKVPFKQFWWSNTASSHMGITPPKEYYSDTYSYTQSKSIYNQMHFRSAELVISSSKTLISNAAIDNHGDPDASSEVYSHTDEISVVLRLINFFEKLVSNKSYIALYILACMIFLFFFIVIVTFPFYFKEPYVSSDLSIDNYFGNWGNISQFPFRLSVKGWDPNRLNTTQRAQEQLYNINKITKHWKAPNSAQASFAVDGRCMSEYMNDAYTTKFISSKLNSPFFIDKYRHNSIMIHITYVYEYLRDYNSFAITLLKWLEEVNFTNSASAGVSKCPQCVDMYYLLQYIIQIAPVSLMYYSEMSLSLMDSPTANFVQTDHYVDLYIVQKLLLDTFSVIHDKLWNGKASWEDEFVLFVFKKRYEYYTNFNSPRLENYNEQNALELINSVAPNEPLPSMVEKHSSVIVSLMHRLYGRFIIFSGIALLFFVISMISYIVVGCVFLYKSIFLTMKLYHKISNVTKCACGIKFLMSCFIPIDLVICVPLLLVLITILSVPILYGSIVTILAIFRNYIFYPQTTKAILSKDLAHFFPMLPLSHQEFYEVQYASYYMLVLLILFASFSHHVSFRIITTMAMIGSVNYTKDQEKSLFEAGKNPFIVSINEEITICRPLNESLDSQATRDTEHSALNIRRDEQTNTLEYVEHGPNDNPLLTKQLKIKTAYNLPIFLPPIFIPKQKLESIEVFLRYCLIILFLSAMYLVISISKRAEYTPKNITTAFLDQMLQQYNLVRVQISQMYAYPAANYKEPHLFINTFAQLRYTLAFLVTNKYTQGLLFIPVQAMQGFKDMGIDTGFYDYGQNIKSFLRSNTYGFKTKVTKKIYIPMGQTIESDSFVPTTWMSNSKYYNIWSTYSPGLREKTFAITKIPNYYRDASVENTILLSLYQKLFLFEYAYYQSNFANSEILSDKVLIRSGLGTYGNSFTSLSPESKRVIFYDLARNQIWKDSFYCDHYTRMSSMLLYSISVSLQLFGLSVLLTVIVSIAIVHSICLGLLLLLYNRRLTLHEIFTVLFLKRIRGLIK